jgi:hypothetical protein
MLAILPSTLTQVFARDHGLRPAGLPYVARPVQVQAIWHERSDQDPAHAGLRAQIANSAGLFDGSYRGVLRGRMFDASAP